MHCEWELPNIQQVFIDQHRYNMGPRFIDLNAYRVAGVQPHPTILRDRDHLPARHPKQPLGIQYRGRSEGAEEPANLPSALHLAILHPEILTRNHQTYQRNFSPLPVSTSPRTFLNTTFSATNLVATVILTSYPASHRRNIPRVPQGSPRGFCAARQLEKGAWVLPMAPSTVPRLGAGACGVTVRWWWRANDRPR